MGTTTNIRVYVSEANNVTVSQNGYRSRTPHIERRACGRDNTYKPHSKSAVDCHIADEPRSCLAHLNQLGFSRDPSRNLVQVLMPARNLPLLRHRLSFFAGFLGPVLLQFPFVLVLHADRITQTFAKRERSKVQACCADW